MGILAAYAENLLVDVDVDDSCRNDVSYSQMRRLEMSVVPSQDPIPGQQCHLSRIRAHGHAQIVCVGRSWGNPNR